MMMAMPNPLHMYCPCTAYTVWTPAVLQYESWGQQILATAVLAIFVTAPIGLLIINLAGPKLLRKVGRS